jgi:hypothetical protein
LSGWSRSEAEWPTGMDKREVPLEAILFWSMKKVSSGDGDTLRREALKRASSTVCR